MVRKMRREGEGGLCWCSGWLDRQGGKGKPQRNEVDKGVRLGGLWPDNDEEEEDMGRGCRSAGEIRLSILRGARMLFV